jgi:hypothetical protein
MEKSKVGESKSDPIDEEKINEIKSIGFNAKKFLKTSNTN